MTCLANAQHGKLVYKFDIINKDIFIKVQQTSSRHICIGSVNTTIVGVKEPAK